MRRAPRYAFLSDAWVDAFNARNTARAAGADGLSLTVGVDDAPATAVSSTFAVVLDSRGFAQVTRVADGAPVDVRIPFASLVKLSGLPVAALMSGATIVNMDFEPSLIERMMRYFWTRFEAIVASGAQVPDFSVFTVLPGGG